MIRSRAGRRLLPGPNAGQGRLSRHERGPAVAGAYADVDHDRYGVWVLLSMAAKRSCTAGRRRFVVEIRRTRNQEPRHTPRRDALALPPPAQGGSACRLSGKRAGQSPGRSRRARLAAIAAGRHGTGLEASNLNRLRAGCAPPPAMPKAVRRPCTSPSLDSFLTVKCHPEGYHAGKSGRLTNRRRAGSTCCWRSATAGRQAADPRAEQAELVSPSSWRSRPGHADV